MYLLKKYKISLLFVGLFSISSVLISCSSDDSKDSDTVVESTRELNVNLGMNLQTMESFGASDAWQCNNIGKNWPINKKNAIADLLFSKEVDSEGNPKGIGLSLWRFNLGAGSTEQGDASDITDEWRRTECFTTDGVSYNMNKQAGQVWFMKAAKERGVDKLLAFTNSAPVYLTQNGKAHATINTFYNLKDGKMPELADFWVNAPPRLTVKVPFKARSVPVPSEIVSVCPVFTVTIAPASMVSWSAVILVLTVTVWVFKMVMVLSSS